MKHTNYHPGLLLSLMAAAYLPLPAMAETKSSISNGNATADARADANANADGNGAKTSSHKQTVTVTSDGKRTIKKTVTIRDGVEEVTTETTDENGKTTVDHGNGSGKDPSAATHDDGPWLGLRVKAVPAALRDQLDLAEDEGVLVDMVAPDGPAEQADIKVNDLLLKLAERKLATPQDLRDELQQHKAGETVGIEVLRKGKRSTVEATLGERPADKDGQEPPQDAKNMLEKARKMLENEPGSGKVEVEVSADADASTSAEGLDAVLKNPNVPEDFKNKVREMQKKLLDFEKEHQPK